jgi:S-ribosylhomocysteine lyase
MGCRTGFYVILEGDLNPEAVLPLVKELLEWIIAFEGAIPGASAKECGNWQEQNLEMAKWEARRYAGLLEKAGRENFNYPE